MYISDEFSIKVKKYICDNFNEKDYSKPGAQKVKGAQEMHTKLLGLQV